MSFSELIECENFVFCDVPCFINSELHRFSHFPHFRTFTVGTHPLLATWQSCHSCLCLSLRLKACKQVSGEQNHPRDSARALSKSSSLSPRQLVIQRTGTMWKNVHRNDRTKSASRGPSLSDVPVLGMTCLFYPAKHMCDSINVCMKLR